MRPRAAAVSHGPRRRDLLGAPIAVTDYEQAMDEMERMIASREPGYVCAVPVHSLMVSRHDDGMRAALRGATMNVPDGRPLVWALNLLGEQPARPRLRPRPDGPLLRAGRAPGSSHLAVRRRDGGSARRARPRARVRATPASRSPGAGRRRTGR